MTDDFIKILENQIPTISCNDNLTWKEFKKQSDNWIKRKTRQFKNMTVKKNVIKTKKKKVCK